MSTSDRPAPCAYQEQPGGLVRQSLSDIRFVIATLLLTATTFLLEGYEILEHSMMVMLGLVRKPLALKDHPFIEPNTAKGDVRSPCPALNTLAPISCRPRNGRDITPLELLQSLMQGFALSPFLAGFLTFGSFFLMGQFRALSLSDLCRHNCIEHAASLVHKDPKRYAAGDYSEYAPARLSIRLWDELREDMRETGRDDGFMDVEDVARARVRREREDMCPLDGLHRHIARGEIGLVLDIFGGPERRVPMEWLEHWWLKEEFPPDWRIARAQTFLRTARTGNLVKEAMERIEREEPEKKTGKVTLGASLNGNAT